MSQRIFRAIVIVGAYGLSACKDAVDPGGTPTTIEIISTAPANGVVNSAVTPGPTFLVKNETGAVMAANVTITVTAGGGTLAGQPAKSGLSSTGIGTWTLGKTVGTNTVSVTTGSLAPITFTVTSTPAPPKKVVEFNPPAVLRTALANTTLSSAITVAVRDTFDNGIAGQTVTFSIIAGGGSLTGNLTATTDASGNAPAPAWKLGKGADGAGSQKMRAASGSTTPGEVSATVQTSYNIVVRFFTTSGQPQMTPAQQALFTSAAQRIMGVVTGDLANVAIQQDVSACLDQPTGTTVLNETADDIVIYATGKTIDGQGQILGSASPCYIRSGFGCVAGCDKIPIMGVMQFDIADLALPGLQDVITHEMLHVLGVGSLWGSDPVFGFNFLTGAGTLDPRFTAQEARLACVAVGGSVSCGSNVPVEGCANNPSCQPPNGGGTRDSHWRDQTFGSELMTGFLNSGANPFSSVTIGALKDMGYVVNDADNDTYSIFAGSIMANSVLAPAASPFSANWEGLHRAPLYGIDLSGRNVRLLRKAQ